MGNEKQKEQRKEEADEDCQTARGCGGSVFAAMRANVGVLGNVLAAGGAFNQIHWFIPPLAQSLKLKKA
jgi:hypothetical protein